MFFNNMSDDAVKKELQDNLDYLKNIDVKEYTLYRKWIDINIQKWTTKQKILVSQIKSNIWIPKNNDDYITLEPEVVFVENKDDQLIWRILRTFTHTGSWKQSPGRLLKFYVKDKITNKYLGIMSFGSDFIGIGGREKVIGWTMEHRMKDGMLKHTMMGSTISPTQPLGFNYLGGKLIALLCASKPVENAFNNRYPETLAGITTTSLYGSFSQYTRLQNWKKCKSSDGKISLEPTDDVYNKAKDWFKTKYPEKYKDISSRSHPKSRLLSEIYKEFGTKKYENNAPRGVYWCPLYENTNEFLRREDDKLGKKKFDNSVKALTDIWKEKYAKKRILKNKDIIEPLFYNDIIGMSWDKVKANYLDDVGR